jgi:peptidoglycan/xylan/chitin deacetylase (PgdA/CDA1 family)
MKNDRNQLCVLMYHGIITEWTTLPEERETGAELYDVTLGRFQQQMEWLNAHHYDVGILDEEFLMSERKRVILTFDDGEMNNFEHAFPVLKKHGFPAYFFIISKRVGLKGYLDWNELREMHDAGMIIGSHGLSHEILTNLLDTQIEEELRASKRYLEKNLNVKIDTLSIPRGFCDDNVIQKAYEVGYKRIFISDRPRKLQSDCYSRSAVKSSWPIKRFAQTLDDNIPILESGIGAIKSAVKRIFGEGLYNWMRQTVLKIK